MYDYITFIFTIITDMYNTSGNNFFLFENLLFLYFISLIWSEYIKKTVLHLHNYLQGSIHIYMHFWLNNKTHSLA